MKNIVRSVVVFQFLATSVAHGYTGEASVGLNTVVSPDINESALWLAGHVLVGRSWSLGLTGEMGFGDPKDALERPMLQSLDQRYNGGLKDGEKDCHLSAIQGYDYRGISVNLGAHPLPQDPAFRVYLGLGNHEYRNYQIICTSGGTISNEKSRLGNKSDYHFSTPVSYGGLSYTGDALGLSWHVFALLQKAMTTKVSGTTDEIYLDESIVDDIAIADRPKIGLALSYVIGNKKAKATFQEKLESDSSEDSRSRKKLRRASVSR